MLEVTYKGKNIWDVLEMSGETAGAKEQDAPAIPEGGEAAAMLKKKDEPEEPAADFTDWTLF